MPVCQNEAAKALTAAKKLGDLPWRQPDTRAHQSTPQHNKPRPPSPPTSVTKILWEPDSRRGSHWRVDAQLVSANDAANRGPVLRDDAMGGLDRRLGEVGVDFDLVRRRDDSSLLQQGVREQDLLRLNLVPNSATEH